MADTKVRVITLKFTFGRDSSEPTDDEMFGFCREQQISPEEVYSIHKEKDSRAIFVKFKNENFMKVVLRNMQPVLTFNYANGKAVNVTVSEAENTFKYIRVFNIPPEVEDREIYQALSPYGTIKQQVREKYHPKTGYPVFSTVRGLYMEVSREIPPQVRMRHYQARIYYEGMVNKCFTCQSTEHLKANCPRRNASQNQSSVQGRLYSSIVESRDLRADFAKRMEVTQMECQMTVLSKQSETMPQEPSVSGMQTRSKPKEDVESPGLSDTSGPSSPVLVNGIPVSQDVEKTKDDDEDGPFIEQKSKKRGRKKNREDKDESSNESDPDTPIKVPGSTSLLDAQQGRTRSRSKKQRSVSQQPRVRSRSKQSRSDRAEFIKKNPNVGLGAVVKKTQSK